MAGIPTLPDIQGLTSELAEAARYRNNPAGYMIERLKAQLKIFQRKISDDAEVGIMVAGNAGTFHLRQISVSNPDMLIFDGIDQDGRTMQLFQHHSQLSVMLVEVPKIEDQPYRIGFTT
ncbi:hypothetical protein [Nitrobacter sp.]|jgi:hypothetical protein|uniref:hypothetical protein n=1 Tax=Nitrobacter sp. TaxID=29420 RepID=UPI0029CABA1B|nr:hypothetical protein [Nitrobacter sp.]